MLIKGCFVLPGMTKTDLMVSRSLMVHGSYENRSEISRRAFVLNVFADGTLSNTDEDILVGVPEIAKGKKMEGQFFPVLFDVEKL